MADSQLVSQQCLEELLIALQRLDQLLERATIAAQAVYGSEASNRAYRGLHISQDEVDRLLTRETGDPILYANDANELLSDFQASPRLAWIEQVYQLSPFEMNVILLTLAPEIDLRYERLYAYLQDDVTRKRPTVDLVLNLLCPSRVEKLMWRAYFAPDAALIKHRLLHLFPDSNQPQPPLLSHYLKLDEQIVRLLLGQSGLDPRVANFCQPISPDLEVDEQLIFPEIKRAVQGLVNQAWQNHQSLRLYFQGPTLPDARCMATALAHDLNITLLIVSLRQLLMASVDFELMLNVLFRAAWFEDIILYLEEWEHLQGEENAIFRQQFLEVFADNHGMVILVGTQPWAVIEHHSLRLITVPFPSLDVVQRRMSWQVYLANAGIQLNESEMQRLGDRFRLTRSQIAAAVTMACNRVCWRDAIQSSETIPPSVCVQPTVEELFAAARSQCGHDLATLTQKIESSYTWNDIVLPEDALVQLQEICQRVVYRHAVFAEWGFENKLSYGRGVTILFAGSSGTGKTMAAGIIANDLGLDLYKIELSGVVSKYIGETEKNLDRIFTAAENANAILFFDEADALFGKRSEVRDSHDRYANLEISYLLQKMEEYEGLAILATNLRQNLDEAFVRRLAFTIHFPSPEVEDRQRLWRGVFPAQVPLAADVDFDWLASRFKFSGGNIKNIALAAAFLAAAAGSPITMAHLLQATRREYQKMGKTLSDADLKLDGLEGAS